MTRTIGIRVICVAAAVILALASIFGVAKLTTDPAFYQKSIAALEEKQETVLELTAASTAGIGGDHAAARATRLHRSRTSWRISAAIFSSCSAPFFWKNIC